MVNNYLLPGTGTAPEINRLLPISIIAFVIYDQVYSLRAQKKMILLAIQPMMDPVMSDPIR